MFYVFRIQKRLHILQALFVQEKLNIGQNVDKDLISNALRSSPHDNEAMLSYRVLQSSLSTASCFSWISNKHIRDILYI